MTRSETKLSTSAARFKDALPWRRLFMFPALLIAAVLLCYANSFHVPFVFDDYHSIVDNPRIQEPFRWLSHAPFRQPRVLVDLTFALNHTLGGQSVFGYHLINTAVHAVNALLVYALTLTLLSALKQRRNRTPTENLPSEVFALVTALVFACHPIQTQAVTYISQRYTSMAAMFYLASILFFLQGRLVWSGSQISPTPFQRSSGILPSHAAPSSFQLHDVTTSRLHQSRFAVSFLLFGLCALCALSAFLSKQNSASLPVMMLLVEYVVFDRSWRGWARKALTALPLLLLFAGFVLYAIGGISTWRDFGALMEDVDRATRETQVVDRWTYAVTQLRVLCIYLGLLMLPVRQCLDYAYPFTSSFFSGWTPFAAAALLTLMGAGFFSLRRNPLFSLAVGWFFVALSVESTLFPIRDALFEHRLYLPSVAFGWVVSLVLFWILKRHRTTGILVTATVILALGTATHLRNRVWQNPVALWHEAVRCNPSNARAYNNLGKAFMDSGNHAEARKAFQVALQLNPMSFDAQLNLGLALARQGLVGEALPALQQSLALRPENPKSLYNIALAYHKMRLYESAQSYYERALKADPDLEKAALNLANLFVEQKQPDQAVKILSSYIETHPNAVDAVYNLAFIHLENHRGDEALKVVGAALARTPRSVPLWVIKADFLSRLGRYDAARSALEEALRLSPKNPEALALRKRLSAAP
ncbi:MAG: tetratricopeptide repeat protein [Desulfosoma sp.]